MRGGGFKKSFSKLQPLPSFLERDTTIEAYKSALTLNGGLISLRAYRPYKLLGFGIIHLSWVFDLPPRPQSSDFLVTPAVHPPFATSDFLVTPAVHPSFSTSHMFIVNWTDDMGHPTSTVQVDLLFKSVCYFRFVRSIFKKYPWHP